MLNPFWAHGLCLLLVAIDLVVRTWRIQAFATGGGFPLSFADAFTLNTFGEAASTVTPLRSGGEPARLWGLLRARIPLSPSLALLATEAVSYYAAVAVAAALLGWAVVPDWWAEVGPTVTRTARQLAPWIAVLVVLTVLVAVWVRRRLAHTATEAAAVSGTPATRRESLVRRLLRDTRRFGGWPLALSVPLTLISVASRIAILPVLGYTLPDPPPLTALAVGSFALTFGQLFLPTPAGAGAVEVGLAGGAAGDLGSATARVAVAWRVYTVVIPVVIGFGLAFVRYGGSAIMRVLRGRGTGVEEG